MWETRNEYDNLHGEYATARDAFHDFFIYFFVFFPGPLKAIRPPTRIRRSVFTQWVLISRIHPILCATDRPSHPSACVNLFEYLADLSLTYHTFSA